MLDALSVHVRPVGDVVEASVIVPLNPFSEATVILDVAAMPALTLTPDGSVVTTKSCIVTVSAAVWVTPLLVPDIWTVYTPVAPEQDKVED